MPRSIKFRRAHFTDDGRFSHFSMWGFGVKGAIFVSPGENNFAEHYTDEQFTGVRDKNLVEAYEGDIIRHWPTWRPADTTVYKVKFNTARFLFVQNVLNVKEIEICGKYVQWEIIGNIHENPELLKGGE